MIWDKMFSIATMAFKLSLFRCSLSHSAVINLNRMMIFACGNSCLFSPTNFHELYACYRDGLLATAVCIYKIKVFLLFPPLVLLLFWAFFEKKWVSLYIYSLSDLQQYFWVQVLELGYGLGSAWPNCPPWDWGSHGCTRHIQAIRILLSEILVCP